MVKNILFDFDGVILDSMPIRTYGFKKIFEEYPEDLVDKLITYHLHNGGLSRFHKIKYFYNELLKEDIDENKVQKYAEKFSKIMKIELTNAKYLIHDSVDFIKSNHLNYELHIVSGSEHNELNYLCEQLNLKQYFKTINGSPTHKNILVKNLLAHEKYNISECILIGDSINDYEASNNNNIDFCGYNNLDLKSVSKCYIENFKNFMKGH